MKIIKVALYRIRLQLLALVGRYFSSKTGRFLRARFGKQTYGMARGSADLFMGRGGFDRFVNKLKFGGKVVDARAASTPAIRAGLPELLRLIFGKEAEQFEPHFDLLTAALVDSIHTMADLELVETTLATCRTRHSQRPVEVVRSNPKSAPLKILIVSGMFPSVDHGGGLRLFDIINELLKRHTVELYSVYNAELDAQSMRRLLGPIPAMRLVQEDGFNYQDLVSWLGRGGRTLTDFDVIQFEYPASAPIAVSCADLKIRTAFTLMEGVTRSLSIDLPRVMGSARLGSTLKAMVKNFKAEKDALQHVDYGVAVTDADADFAARVFDVKRPTVVPTGLSPEIFVETTESTSSQQVNDNSAAFIGFYGHFPNVEGVEWFLKHVHAKVKAKIPDFKFYVIGRGDTSYLETLAKGDPSVVFTGRVENVLDWLAKARICVSPLHSGSGIRGKLNQYAAAGRPCVSTSIGLSGLPYVDGKSVLEANEPDDFANAIVRLLQDKKLWTELQQSSAALVKEQFAWPSIIRGLEGLYHS